MPSVTLSTEASARFAFGANWQRYVSRLSPEQAQAAQKSLERVFGVDGLRGKTFLDLGCGSGLFSLAAHRLGARVISVDIDPDSVECAEELRRREQADDDLWTIQTGSALDEAGLAQLGTFDIVYSWGVLHHTGSMWPAIDLAAQRVAPGGLFWLAIYNDQGTLSSLWRWIKQTYVHLPRWLQTPYVVLVGGVYYGQRIFTRLVLLLLASLLKRPDSPASTQALSARQAARGMSRWTDLVDWIGGYPFEVAKPEEILHFLRERGFRLEQLRTCGGGLGCNEFIFMRHAPAATNDATKETPPAS